MTTAEPALAASCRAVPQSRIRELADIAMSMSGVLKLYFGESDQPTPRRIKDAAIAAINSDFTFYTQNAGIPELRRAIADKYRELHGIEMDPMIHVMVGASGVQALHVAMRCLLDPGDEAIILTPAWPNSSGIASLCSAAAVQLPHRLKGTRFEIDFHALESSIRPATRLILYTSPSNPLGWVASEGDQDRLLDICRRHGLWLVADEVYERLFYGGPVAPSLLRRCGREEAVVVIQSFSKSYCMTGWRLGWLVSNSALIRKAAQLNEFAVSHAPTMIQRAGVVALGGGEGEIQEMVTRLRHNRDLLGGILRQIPGLTVPEPDGAFYLFPRIEGVEDSFDFCRRLLLEEKVGIAPGVAFGKGGEGSVRLCYAADPKVLVTAAERMDHFIRRMR